MLSLDCRAPLAGLGEEALDPGELAGHPGVHSRVPGVSTPPAPADDSDQLVVLSRGRPVSLLGSDERSSGVLVNVILYFR